MISDNMADTKYNDIKKYCEILKSEILELETDMNEPREINDLFIAVTKTISTLNKMER